MSLKLKEKPRSSVGIYKRIEQRIKMTNLQANRLRVLRESLYWETMVLNMKGLLSESVLIGRLNQINLMTKKLEGKN